MPTLRDLRPAVRRTARTLCTPTSSSRNHVVDCAIYTNGYRQEGFSSYHDAISEIQDSGRGFVWIGLHEPNHAELAGLSERFDLHPLAVEDAVQAHQRPKLECYDTTLFAVFKTVRYVAETEGNGTSSLVETGDLMVFLGRDFVLTIRHGEHGDLRQLRRTLESNPERLRQGPSAVLHAVADHIVDSYLVVTDALQDDVERVEREVFSSRRTTDAERIYLIKREVLDLRRAIAPLTQPLRSLTATSPLIQPEIVEYFRDVADHLARVSEQISGLDELLTTLIQANLAQVTVAQNEDMRKISAWVAIISVPTAVAGIYGMNFDHMPELHWQYGYLSVMAVIVAVCLALHRGFRRNGWL